MTGAFSYQPALLARRLTFTVTPTGLTCRTAEGDEKWRLDWAQVTAAAFVEHRVRGNLFRRLDLLTGASGGRQSVSITCGRVAPAADPDSAAHLGLVAAILDQLAARAGGFEVRIGEYGRHRLAIFGVGLAAVAGAVGLFALALVTGAAGGKLAGAAVPLLLLGAFGGALVVAYAPWREPACLPARTLARALRIMAASGDVSPDPPS